MLIAWGSALAGVLVGLLAVLASLRVRRDLASQLGRDWRVRFVTVQAGPINLVLFAVLHYLAIQQGWDGTTAAWGLVLAYGPVFFGYSLANIDWTARKFHGVGG